jgi:hypothetical protein
VNCTFRSKSRSFGVMYFENPASYYKTVGSSVPEFHNCRVEFVVNLINTVYRFRSILSAMVNANDSMYQSLETFQFVLNVDSSVSRILQSIFLVAALEVRFAECRGVL